MKMVSFYILSTYKLKRNWFTFFIILKRIKFIFIREEIHRKLLTFKREKKKYKFNNY